MPRSAFFSPDTMLPSTARRITNQIQRAVRRTFGAQAGLRALVQIGVREMTAAGASRDEMREELIRCVTAMPSVAPGDRGPVVASEAESAALKALILGWADEFCARQGSRSASS